MPWNSEGQVTNESHWKQESESWEFIQTSLQLHRVLVELLCIKPTSWHGRCSGFGIGVPWPFRQRAFERHRSTFSLHVLNPHSTYVEFDNRAGNSINSECQNGYKRCDTEALLLVLSILRAWSQVVVAIHKERLVSNIATILWWQHQNQISVSPIPLWCTGIVITRITKMNILWILRQQMDSLTTPRIFSRHKLNKYLLWNNSNYTRPW